MNTYSVIMTKIYQVSVVAKDEKHAEELFDNYSSDWEELLKVHRLDVVEDNMLIVGDKDD